MNYDYKKDLKELIENMINLEGKNKENENKLKFYEYYENEKELAIVMDLYDGNLEKYYLERNKSFNIEEIKDLLLQLNENFKIMIEKNIIINFFGIRHILIKKRNNKNIYCFNYIGVSKLNLNIKQKYESSLNVGAKLDFIAPELIENKDYNIKSFLWSLGALIYVLSFKAEFLDRFNHKNKEFDSLKKTRITELDNLIQQLLIKDPNKRLNWEQYTLHTFFTMTYSLNSQDKLKVIWKKVDILTKLTYFYENGSSKVVTQTESYKFNG